MFEAVLGVIVIALVGIQAYSLYEARKSQKDLLRALLSKDAKDFADAEFIDKIPKQNGKTQNPEDEYVPITSDNPDLFDKIINQETQTLKEMKKKENER